MNCSRSAVPVSRRLAADSAASRGARSRACLRARIIDTFALKSVTGLYLINTSLAGDKGHYWWRAPPFDTASRAERIPLAVIRAMSSLAMLENAVEDFYWSSQAARLTEGLSNMRIITLPRLAQYAEFRWSP